MAYYKRATVYLALGKSKAALPDLEKSIKLKPDFAAAIVNSGNILLKQGKLNEAREAFEHTVSHALLVSDVGMWDVAFKCA